MPPFYSPAVCYLYSGRLPWLPCFPSRVPADTTHTLPFLATSPLCCHIQQLPTHPLPWAPCSFQANRQWYAPFLRHSIIFQLPPPPPLLLVHCPLLLVRVTCFLQWLLCVVRLRHSRSCSVYRLSFLPFPLYHNRKKIYTCWATTKFYI